MLERTLVHPGHRVQQAVYCGFTCRVARWDTRKRVYVFNGRSGELIEDAVKDDVACLLSTCSFIELCGKPQRAGEAAEQQRSATEAAITNQWNFTGDHPTVTQFLQGMGSTELVHPETAQDLSEVPSDALNYNNAPEIQTRTFGRTRRPAPVELDVDDKEDSSDDETSQDKSDDDSDSDDAGEKAAVLKKLGITTEQPTQQADNIVTSVVATKHESESADLTSRANVSSTASGASTSQPQPTSSGPIMGIPEYDRSYAKVDKNGLTGFAGLQAEWELAHPVQTPPKRKLNKHGIARREPNQTHDLSPQVSSSSSSAPVNSTSGGGLHAPQPTPTPLSLFSSKPPIAMLEYQEPEEAPWANTIVPSIIPTGDLVDLSVPQSRTAPGPVRPSAELMHSSQGANISPIKPLSTQRLDQNKPPNLIDFSSAESVRSKPSSEFSWNDPPLKPTVKPTVKLTVVSNGRQEEQGEDCIVERLQDPTDQNQPVRYTMKQKAGKKKKSNKANAGIPKPKVQLPKPDPPPQPKPKPTAAPAQPDKNDTASTQLYEAESDSDSDASVRTAIKKSPECHIERLLRDVEPLHGRSDVELQVSFGMIVVRPRDEALDKGIWGSSALQRTLQAAEDKGDFRTDFFERLTTSDSDAAFLLDLLPGQSLQPRVEYEVTVKLLQGDTRVIKFDQMDPGSFAVYAPEEVAATLYMHYPIRVHDGRSRVIRSELVVDVDAAILKTFISSIKSIDGAPSFSAAVPNTSFSVERVHVKRIFAKQIVEGVQLKVEETQDLKLDPIAGEKDFNLKATAGSKAWMVDNNRLWYECSLHLAPLGGVQGDVLQSLIDKMVAEMDGVGYYNQGPYLKTEIEKEPKKVVKFW